MSDVQSEVLHSAPHASCLIGGPACGKTTALVACAKQRALSGKGGGVLYVCASRAAAERVRAQLSGFDIEVKTGLELACEVLGDQALVARGVRNRLLGRAEERVLMEDVKVCGIKRRRLRELVAFLECGWSNLDDSDPDWIKTNEEELVSGLIRGNLEFTGGVLPCEASALAYREVAADEGLRARHARSAVFVDDYECLGRATQMLACALAADSVRIAAGDVAPVALDEPYPYAAGVEEFLAANPSAQVERLNECYRPTGVIAMLNRLRADESLNAAALRVAGEAGALPQSAERFAETPLEGMRAVSADASGRSSGCFAQAVVEGFCGNAGLNRAQKGHEGNDAGCGAEPSAEVDVLFASGIVAEFADIASRVKKALEQGISSSHIFIAGTNAAWRANLLRCLEQAGIPARSLGRGKSAGGEPSLRVLVGEGDPLHRSVQVARLRDIAQPQGLRMQEALQALAAGSLEGASANDPLLDGLADAYWAARGKMAAFEEAAHAKDGAHAAAGKNAEYVQVGAPIDACGRQFDLVIFGGFVNGFIPSADYCDPAALVGAARQRAHAADVQAVYRCVAAAGGRVAFTGFSECSLEAAEQLKLHIARIKLKHGVRMCAIEPSELLGALGITA